MTDRIEISQLRALTHIGVTDEERSTEQAVLVDVVVDVEMRRAGASDDLAHTIDYGSLTTEIAELVRRSRVRLLEKLAEDIADHVTALSGVERVSVGVAKESPPVTEDVGSIAVRIMRP